MELLKKTEYKCFSCGQIFGSLGEMQTHVVVEHLQKPGFAEKLGNKKEVQTA
ncbi:MAG TPA: hypothetical protein VHA09_04540 [Nitrososphaera sp.]|nr:hypothetical protein [Nitrososphaera sp.]